MIGTFTLPLGQLMFDLIDERKREMEEVEHIIDEIENMDMDMLIANYRRKSKIDVKWAKVAGSAFEYADQEFDDEVDIEARKSKKKYNKAFKNVDNSEEFKEGLGANEDQGNMVAEQTQESQIEAV